MRLDNESEETAALLALAEDGDLAAINLLFEKNLPMVKAIIGRRLRPEARRRFDTSDVVQETHQSARRQLPDFLCRRPMAFRLWLIKTALQRLTDLERTHLYVAKRAVDREVPLPDRSSMDLLAVLGGGTAPLDRLQIEEQAQTVRRCLAELPDLDRQVLMLRVFDSLKNVEVAQVLGITADASKKRFARAIERLRILLAKAGIEG